MRWCAVPSILLFVVGCSGGSDDTDRIDAGPRDAGSSGSDGGPRDGSVPSGETILARTATRTHDCSGTLGAMAEVGEIHGHDFAVVGDDAYALRLASTATTISDPGVARWLEIAPLNADGSRGTAQIVAAGEGPRRELATGTVGDAVVAVWQEDEMLRSAVVETNGALRSGPHTLSATSEWIPALTVLPHDSGALVVWTSQSTPGANALGRIHAVVVDATGAAIGAPTVVLERPTAFGWIAPTIVRSGGGYAFAFALTNAEGGAVGFGRFDGSGTLVEPVREIATTPSRFLGFASDRVALHPTGSGFVIAWAITKPTQDWDEPTWTMVQLARLDADGQVVDGPYDLDTPEDDFDVVEPMLFGFGDALALTWGRGSHIYACAGCVPDHDVHLVLLDPERLAPVSDVATIVAAPSGGGLLRRRHVVVGEHVATTFDVTFHVWDRYGEGDLSCVAR